MEFLPDLDIQEDLELLAAEDSKDVSIAVQDLSKDIGKTAPRDIFVGKPTNGSKPQPPVEKRVVKKGTVTPINDTVVLDNLVGTEDEPEEVIEVLNTKKVKKPLSEKQKAHLAKIRVKALEAKKEKARLKKEVKERVEVEVREKRGKKRVQIIEKDVSDKATKEFAEQIQKPLPKQEQPNYNFNNFMQHMEQYQRMTYDYQMKQLEVTKKREEEERRKKQEEEKRVSSQMAQLKYQQSRLSTPIPSTIQPPKPKNPYDNIFSW